MYSNISQILLQYKTWVYYKKIDSTKSMGVCYWCVKIPQPRYMGHGLKVITFYVQKHIVEKVSWSRASSRQAARSARICESGLLDLLYFQNLSSTPLPSPNTRCLSILFFLLHSLSIVLPSLPITDSLFPILFPPLTFLFILPLSRSNSLWYGPIFTYGLMESLCPPYPRPSSAHETYPTLDLP